MKIVMHSGASWSFNSRPRTEGIICHLRPPFTADQFQFSPSHRGHPRQRLIMYGPLLFQFSPSHRGHRAIARVPESARSFNSRPRTEGIDISARAAHNKEIVSILALAQRASSLPTPCCGALLVSILALAQRASTQQTLETDEAWSFNSRPRTEGIRNSSPSSICRFCFNSRPRTEGILPYLRYYILV